ncbi:MAG TPA: NAD(P)H-hydrate epimerase, partial [archaeon]|nr:NAD(P)H-hydrate epimerase [archaeon]
MQIPTVSVEQMVKIDDLAIRHFGVDLVQLMENAGRVTAALAREILGRLENRRITILVGKGNNGGDAITAARHLHNWGAKVTVIVPDHPDNFSQINKEQLGILRSMFLERLFSTQKLLWEDSIQKADLIIDGLLGYKINRNPECDYALLINYANSSKAKILSIDTPSGLNPDTGDPHSPCIQANFTLSLSLLKRGLIEKKAREFV